MASARYALESPANSFGFSRPSSSNRRRAANSGELPPSGRLGAAIARSDRYQAIVDLSSVPESRGATSKLNVNGHPSQPGQWSMLMAVCIHDGNNQSAASHPAVTAPCLRPTCSVTALLARQHYLRHQCLCDNSELAPSVRWK